MKTSVVPAVKAPFAPQGFGRTQRRDAWWVEAIPVIILLGGFGILCNVAGF